MRGGAWPDGRIPDATTARPEHGPAGRTDVRRAVGAVRRRSRERTHLMRTAGGHGGPSIRGGHGVSVGERLVQRHCVCRLVLDDVWVWADRTCTRRGCAPRRPLQEPGRGRTRTAAAAGPRSQRSMARFAGSSEPMRPTTREIGLRQRVPGASNRTRLSGSRVATAEAPGGDADTPGTPVLRYTPDAASGPMFTDRDPAPRPGLPRRAAACHLSGAL
jgi:hypothetical protein